MPSTERTWRTVGAAVALVVLCYATLITAQLLLGTLTAVLAYLTGWTLGRVGPAGLVGRMGSGRATAVVVLGAAGAGYAVAVVERPLFGLSLALLLFAVAWLTAPDGPLVRAARWLRAARDDLRAVRTALTDGEETASESTDD